MAKFDSWYHFEIAPLQNSEPLTYSVYLIRLGGKRGTAKRLLATCPNEPTAKALVYVLSEWSHKKLSDVDPFLAIEDTDTAIERLLERA